MNFKAEDVNIYSKISAGLFAEILNDFFATLSYDTIVKFILIYAVCMIIRIICAYKI